MFDPNSPPIGFNEILLGLLGVFLAIFFLFIGSHKQEPDPQGYQVQIEECQTQHPDRYWIGAYELVDGTRGNFLMSACGTETWGYQTKSKTHYVYWLICPPPNKSVRISETKNLDTVIRNMCIASLHKDTTTVTVEILE